MTHCMHCHGDIHTDDYTRATCALERASADLSLWATELDDATAHLSAMNANYMDAIDREDRARRKHAKAVLWLHTCLMRVRETAGTIDEVAA